MRPSNPPPSCGRIVEDLPRSLALGVLGLNGVTALIGLDLIGAPRRGDTVVVSTAAGPVGSAVGQIAKIRGCRAVGIAGGPEKTAMCRALFGYDAAIDYRAPGLVQAINSACPKGVDVYFDNTSGPVSDAVYPSVAIGEDRHLRHGRDLELGPLADWAAHRAPSARQARPGAGLRHLRLRRSMAGLGREARRLSARREAPRYQEDILDGLEA